MWKNFCHKLRFQRTFVMKNQFCPSTFNVKFWPNVMCRDGDSHICTLNSSYLDAYQITPADLQNLWFTIEFALRPIDHNYFLILFSFQLQVVVLY
jgi:hypothetical protein